MSPDRERALRERAYVLHWLTLLVALVWTGIFVVTETWHYAIIGQIWLAAYAVIYVMRCR
jgi:hypothetical protein